MVLLVAAIVATVALGVLLVVLGRVAASAGLAMGELFGASRVLRASVATLLLVHALAIFALAGYLRAWDGAVLEVGGEIRFRRPGVPISGWFSVDKTLDSSEVSAVRLREVGFGRLRRVVLDVSSGDDTIRIDVGRAVEEGADPPRWNRLPARGDWASLPVVKEVEASTGISSST